MSGSSARGSAPSRVKALRSLKARPQVMPGDLLITSEPFAYILKSEFSLSRCSFCLSSCRSSLLRCSGCKTLRFCDVQCHKRAWKEFHRLECRKLRTVSDRVIPDSALLMSRIITKLNNGGDQHRERITDTRQRCFKDLMSHYSDLKTCARRVEHVQSLSVVLRSLLPADQLPNGPELVGIYGRMCVNSFNILDMDMSPVGVGVYLAPSIIDHSCEPNAVVSFSGRRLEIRAAHEITDFAWSKVRISYIDMLADRETRRQELKDGYFFMCDCSRCSSQQFLDLERTVACGGDDCSAAVVIRSVDDSTEAAAAGEGSVGSCGVCGFSQFPASVREELDRVMALSRHTIQQCSTSVYFEPCRLCLDQQKRCSMHPLNVYAVKMLDMAFEAALCAQMWENSLELGQQLIPGYRQYYGTQHPLYGLLLLKLGKVALYLFRHRLAADWLRGAGDVLRITHGCGHQLVVEELAGLVQQLSVEKQLPS